MEYFCYLCHEWYNVDGCETHFDGVHGSTGLTFDKLKTRLEWIGGLQTRDEPIPDSKEDQKRVFVTNNFRHVL